VTVEKACFMIADLYALFHIVTPAEIGGINIASNLLFVTFGGY